MAGWIKQIFNRIDRSLNVDSFRWLSRLGLAARKTTSPDFQRLRQKARSLIPDEGPLRLNLGCGKVRLDGFVNIDHRATSATDLECDIVQLPFDDDTADRIETYHVIEHLGRHEAVAALRKWHRILKSGGVLVIECPDFDAACREYLDGREGRIDNLFGLQRFEGDGHQFGYNFKRLHRLLTECGFRSIVQKPPTDYHKEQEPCLRVEATK
jgi:predicted SAM-dependent methyltransferase